jgi:hypothetical protein
MRRPTRKRVRRIAMKFDDADEKFPRFKSYVRGDFAKLGVMDKDGKGTPVFNALVKWAKIPGTQAVEFFKPGKETIRRPS